MNPKTCRGRPSKEPVEFICKCGNTFTMKVSYLTAYRKLHGHDPIYCSRKCFGIYKRAETEAKNVFTCIQCGGEFPMRRQEYEYRTKYDHTQKLCGLECKAAWQRQKALTKFEAGDFGRHVKRNGYVWISVPALASKTGVKTEMLEHRYVMERHLGRPLTKDETVHHRDGVRANNTIANLELFSSRHGPGQRVEDKIEFAIDMIQRYPEFALRQGYALVKVDS